MYKIIIYSLEGCPYSKNAEMLLKNIKNKKIIKVSQNDKDEYKIKNKMSTFPQIFLINGNQKIKIGGNDNLTNIINLIKNNKKIKTLLKNLDTLVNLNKKQKLRLIELFV